MKKLTLFLTLALIAGLLTSLPLAAQGLRAQGKHPYEPDRIGLLILIDRLELTPTQMREMHDILAGLLEPEATSALSSTREEFYQELIRFSGTREELQTKLEEFRTKLAEQGDAIEEQVKRALQELRGILTIEQGELLREVFSQRMECMRGRMTPQQPPLGERSREGQADPRPFAGTTARPMQRFHRFAIAHPGIWERLLFGTGSRLEEIVDILEMKLQYVES